MKENNIIRINLKKLREKRGLTQEALCCKLNELGFFISRSTYSKYETGDRNISNEALIIFAKFFNTTTDYILGLTSDE